MLNLAPISGSSGNAHVTAGSGRASAAPSRTQFVCQRVVGGRFGGLPEGSPGTMSLQISGGPQGSRTSDLRRAKAGADEVSGRLTLGAESDRDGGSHAKEVGDLVPEMGVHPHGASGGDDVARASRAA